MRRRAPRRGAIREGVVSVCCWSDRVAGASLDAAVNAIEELEETARLYLLLRGAKTRFLTPAQVKELLE